MKRKATSINLSDKELKNLESLKEAYECDSNSEAVRLLIKEEMERVRKYHELNIN